MARPRKPTQLHVISGSAAKHPDRMREREGEPEVDGDLRDMGPPTHLDDSLAEIWREVAKLLHARVAGDSDVLAFEALVRATAMCRSAEATPAWFARQAALMGEFGMTPASRSKVAQGKKPEGKRGFAALKG